MTTTTTDLRADVLDAAREAAAILPAPPPLSPSEPVTAAAVLAALGDDAVAVSADVAGARRGSVLVVAGPALTAALAGSPMGPLPLPEALRPALELLAGALGTSALGTLVERPAAEAVRLLASGPHVLVPLVGDDGAPVWVGVATADTGRGGAPAGSASGAGESLGLEMLQDVVMELSAELGRTRMTVRDLLSLQPGNVVELDRLAGSPADLLVNGRLIARGEVVVVDEDYALKLTELVHGGDSV
jgi:flagellar motor switch protein FliN/FliY